MNEPEIIFENSDFVVINKPAGLMVHGARVSSKRRGAVGVDAVRAAEPTLVDWLIARYPEIKNVGDDPCQRPGIVHRLDKATSGVMIIAKTQASFERLKKLFQEHRMRKTYFALVSGIPKNKKGTIDAPIGIKNGSLKRSIHSSQNGETRGHGIFRDVKKIGKGGNERGNAHSAESKSDDRTNAPDPRAPCEYRTSDRGGCPIREKDEGGCFASIDASRIRFGVFR